MAKVDKTLLAEFVSEALCGLGVADDADELIGYCYDQDGEDAARSMLKRYNNAIEFLNKTLPKAKLRLITEDEYLMYTDQD